MALLGSGEMFKRYSQARGLWGYSLQEEDCNDNDLPLSLSKSWLWSRQFCSVILSWYGALSQNRLQSNKVRHSWVVTSEMWVKKKIRFFLFISWESQYFYGDEKLSHYSSFWSFPNNSSLAWFVASWLQRYSHFCILFFLVTLWSSSLAGVQACRAHITFFVPRHIDCA